MLSIIHETISLYATVGSLSRTGLVKINIIAKVIIGFLTKTNFVMISSHVTFKYHKHIAYYILDYNMMVSAL